jgi:hypothetical protein
MFNFMFLNVNAKSYKSDKTKCSKRLNSKHKIETILFECNSSECNLNNHQKFRVSFLTEIHEDGCQQSNGKSYQAFFSELLYLPDKAVRKLENLAKISTLSCNNDKIYKYTRQRIF